ncbi:MAG: hypothetical protein U1F53_10495 [Burkholderiaceae bacterium]
MNKALSATLPGMAWALTDTAQRPALGVGEAGVGQQGVEPDQAGQQHLAGGAVGTHDLGPPAEEVEQPAGPLQAVLDVARERRRAVAHAGQGRGLGLVAVAHDDQHHGHQPRQHDDADQRRQPAKETARAGHGGWARQGQAAYPLPFG